MFQPCIVIPYYNHPKKIAAVIEQVAAHKVACVLVDDGSDASSIPLLNDLDKNYDNLTVLRMDVNQGKGAAVCYGIRYAQEQGFTHALQVDADGQHNLADIPEFLAVSKDAPSAVVSGLRIYDWVPRSRRSGRVLTDVWVWINTLSLEIKDSMCGFRLYPIKETIELLDEQSVGRRMDFDTDIMVRLYWKGLSIKHVKSRVVYSDEIVSHFDLFKDNVRLTRMHTMHFFGMLVRIPRLLKRKRTTVSYD